MLLLLLVLVVGSGFWGIDCVDLWCDFLLSLEIELFRVFELEIDDVVDLMFDFLDDDFRFFFDKIDKVDGRGVWFCGCVVVWLLIFLIVIFDVKSEGVVVGLIFEFILIGSIRCEIVLVVVIWGDDVWFFDFCDNMLLIVFVLVKVFWFLIVDVVWKSGWIDGFDFKKGVFLGGVIEGDIVVDVIVVVGGIINVLKLVEDGFVWIEVFVVFLLVFLVLFDVFVGYDKEVVVWEVVGVII